MTKNVINCSQFAAAIRHGELGLLAQTAKDAGFKVPESVDDDVAQTYMLAFLASCALDHAGMNSIPRRPDDTGRYLRWSRPLED